METIVFLSACYPIWPQLCFWFPFQSIWKPLLSLQFHCTWISYEPDLFICWEKQSWVLDLLTAVNVRITPFQHFDIPANALLSACHVAWALPKYRCPCARSSENALLLKIWHAPVNIFEEFEQYRCVLHYFSHIIIPKIWYALLGNLVNKTRYGYEIYH